MLHVLVFGIIGGGAADNVFEDDADSSFGPMLLVLSDDLSGRDGSGEVWCCEEQEVWGSKSQISLEYLLSEWVLRSMHEREVCNRLGGLLLFNGPGSPYLCPNV